MRYVVQGLIYIFCFLCSNYFHNHTVGFPFLVDCIICLFLIVVTIPFLSKQCELKWPVWKNRKWDITKFILSYLFYALAFIFVHNLFFGGLHDCIGISASINVGDWRKAYIAIADSVGLCSTVILGIIGVLDKREFGISLARLADFQFPSYRVFIISHFGSIAGILFFSYASYFEVATIFVIMLAYITIILVKIYSVIVLETDKRRKYTLDFYRVKIVESARRGDYLRTLVRNLESGENPDSSDVFQVITAGLFHVTSEYAPEVFDDPEDQKCMTATFRVLPETIKIIHSISTYWTELIKGKNVAERNVMITEFAKNANDPQICNTTDNQYIAIVFSYLFTVLQESKQKGMNMWQALEAIQNEVFYGISDIKSNQNKFYQVAQLMVSLLFWVYVFQNYQSCDYALLRNVALLTESDTDFSAYRHLFFSFVSIVYINSSNISANDDHAKKLIEDCNVAWNQVVSVQSNPVKV